MTEYFSEALGNLERKTYFFHTGSVWFGHCYPLTKKETSLFTFTCVKIWLIQMKYKEKHKPKSFKANFATVYELLLYYGVCSHLYLIEKSVFHILLNKVTPQFFKQCDIFHFD